MTPLTVGCNLWAKGVALNAVALGIIAIPEWGVFAIPVFIASFLLGFVLGSPLLIAFSWLLKVFAQLPYDMTDRLSWLAFALVMATLAFWSVPALLFNVPSKICAPVMTGSSIAVLLACLWATPLIRQLNDMQHERHA